MMSVDICSIYMLYISYKLPYTFYNRGRCVVWVEVGCIVFYFWKLHCKLSYVSDIFLNFVTQELCGKNDFQRKFLFSTYSLTTALLSSVIIYGLL